MHGAHETRLPHDEKITQRSFRSEFFREKTPQKQQKEQILHMIAKNTAHGIGFSIWKNWSYSIRMSILPLPYIQLAVHIKPVNLLPLSQFGHQTRWLLLDSENGTWQKQVDWAKWHFVACSYTYFFCFVLVWFVMLCLVQRLRLHLHCSTLV